MRVVLARSLCIMDVVLNKKVGRSGPRRHSVESIAMAVTLVLLVAICAALWALAKKSGSGKEAPGPFRWPIIGNLPQLRDAIPYRALTDIGKKFGPVFSLQLGSVPVVVVSGLDNIKQVLYHKLNHFDSRPNFNRYHKLFDGDKENSLAFCDWSEVQRKRREILNDHTFPKVYANNFKELSAIITEEVKDLVKEISTDKHEPNVVSKRRQIFALNEPKTMLSKKMKRLLVNKHVSTFVRLPRIEETAEEEFTPKPQEIDIKKKLLETTVSIFLRYFCSIKTEKNEEFAKFIKDFDKIFYEVNQGYASDFLPFLEKVSGNNEVEMKKCSENIRRFVEKEVIRDRLDTLEEGTEDKDYVDALLRNVKFGGDVRLSKETALFSLEDILGGHSAIGNFLVKAMTFIVDNEEVQGRVLQEIGQVGKEFITLDDRDKMPYTDSVIMEALRLIASPIVPHVANQDTQISGYDVKKGTLVFLNNYDLNMSENLWQDPARFEPARFLDPTTGGRVKPAHFLPFGGGRRSCMGYKLVQFVSFVVIANVIKNFQIKGLPHEDYKSIPLGNLALPENTVKFDFASRK